MGDLIDIEDLHSVELSNRENRSLDIVKSRIRSKKSSHISPTLSSNDDAPAFYKVFVQTWGCTHNTSDSEYMAGLLARHGYRVKLGGAKKLDDLPNGNACGDSCDCSDKGCSSDSFTDSTDDTVAKQEADLWLLNSCTVKGPAEDHFRNAVLAGLKMGKRVVVAGCVPQGRPNTDYLRDVSVIGVQQIDRVVEVVEETLRGNTVRFLEKKLAVPNGLNSFSRRLGGAPLDLPKIRRNPLIEILAVSTGCLNACTYCKTKHARGVLASYPIEQLLNRAKQAFTEGVKELWLTSEDLGAYGRDLPRAESTHVCPSMSSRFPDSLTLTDLLSGLLPLIPPGCMLRLGMTNPPYILDQLKEIAAVLSHPRVYAFIHIPVQSGSDAVLDRMKREYTVEEFCDVVTHLTNHMQTQRSATGSGCGALTVATDIICGFPNETEADFEQTLQLVQHFQFPVLYINQFFARPGTPAATMPRKATTAEVKKRTKQLHTLFRSYTPFANRCGSEVRVLVTELSSDGQFWVGHTKAYEQVLVPKVSGILGSIILVRIIECDKFFMRSEIVDTGPFESLLLTDESINQHPDLPTELRLNTEEFPAAVQTIPASSFFSKIPHFKWIAYTGSAVLAFYVFLKLSRRLSSLRLHSST